MVIIIAASSITNDLFENIRKFQDLYDCRILLFNISVYLLQNYGTHQKKEGYYACRRECV
jgi:uncharacterized protein (UPF0276 family)